MTTEITTDIRVKARVKVILVEGQICSNGKQTNNKKQ